LLFSTVAQISCAAIYMGILLVVRAGKVQDGMTAGEKIFSCPACD